MKINSTYGYIRVQKAIYNLEAFYENNKKDLEDIINLEEDPNFGISFELDTSHNVLCAFSIFGDTLLDAEVNFITLIEKLKKAFPNYEILVKIELSEDSDTGEEFFNGFIPNPSLRYCDLHKEK